MFLAWLGCSTLSGIGIPHFTKLCEWPEASVAWPLSKGKVWFMSVTSLVLSHQVDSRAELVIGHTGHFPGGPTH